MAVKSIADLIAEANLIKNAIIPNENTALRVGGTLLDMVDSQFQTILPQPHAEFYQATNEMKVYFMDSGFDFSKAANPEIFLFRYKGRQRKGSSVTVIRKIKAGWKHPATVDSAIKWQGWKFFNGEQSLYGGAITNTRITEWAVPSTIKPYDRVTLTGFNKYMFMSEIDTTGPTLLSFDSNVLGDYNLNDKINTLNSDYVFKLSGTAKRIKTPSAKGFQKVVTYCFALAVDNPNATKLNGLCPKIFSAFSNPMHIIWNRTGLVSPATDVSVVNSVNGIYSRPVFK